MDRRLLLYAARRRFSRRAFAGGLAALVGLALLTATGRAAAPPPAAGVELAVQVPNAAYFDLVEVSTACCLVASAPIDAAGRATFALPPGDYLVSAPASGVGATHLRVAIPQRVHLDGNVAITLREG